MATPTPVLARSFKDLIVWQRAMDLAVRTHQITAGLAVRYRYSLAEQMNRAAISIVSNIAEGAGRCRPGEYRYHVGVARGSLAELETQILLGRRMNVILEAEADSMIQLVEETGKLLSGLVRRLSPPRGTRGQHQPPSTSTGH